MLTKIEKISRRLSRMSTVKRLSTIRGYNYRSSSTAVPEDQSPSTTTTCAEPSNGNSNGYKHFEIVSLDENYSETTFNNQQTTGSSVKRRKSKITKVQSFQKQKRAKRENRAIFMTFLVSISYLICYMEIINFYTLASFTEPRTLFDKVLGIKGNSLVETYVYLWYYYSLFAAAATNVLLHFLFNHVVRNGFTAKGIKSRDELNRRSSVKSCTMNGNR